MFVAKNNEQPFGCVLLPNYLLLKSCFRAIFSYYWGSCISLQVIALLTHIVTRCIVLLYRTRSSSMAQVEADFSRGQMVDLESEIQPGN